MSNTRGKARETILESAEALVKEHGAATITVEAVAKAAGTAKGLIHYHFKTKQGLLSAVAHRLTESRTKKWADALKPGAQISPAERSWKLLADESATGVTLAWQTLLCLEAESSDHRAKAHVSEFSKSLGTALARLFEEDMGLTPTVPVGEIGWLMTAVIDGVGLQLLSGAGGEDLQGAYAASWLGMLSLTTAT